jgi:hypothetical protein
MISFKYIFLIYIVNIRLVVLGRGINVTALRDVTPCQSARWVLTFLENTLHRLIDLPICQTIYPEDRSWRFFRIYVLTSPKNSRDMLHQSFLLHILFCRLKICCYPLPLLLALFFSILFYIAVCECLRSKTTHWLDNAGTEKENLKQNHSVRFEWLRNFNPCQVPFCELKSSFIHFTLPSLISDVPLKLWSQKPKK